MNVVDPDAPLGRDRELAEVDAFLSGLPAGLSAIALTGAAGIGKTTVWRWAARQARARGLVVLAIRPGQAERSLSFAGLADLLDPVPDEAFNVLTPVQRHALDVALLRAEAGPSPPGGAVHAAVLSLVRHLAAAGPVLIAVDDAQWLDDATAESLAFALRRVEHLPVGVLVSVRLAGGRPVTLELAIDGGRRRDVLLGPVSVAVMHAIVKRQLSRSLPRPVLVRWSERSPKQSEIPGPVPRPPATTPRGRTASVRGPRTRHTALSAASVAPQPALERH